MSAELQATYRFAALCILTHWDAEGHGGPPRRQWPERVRDLIAQFGESPIGTCNHCQQWSVLDAKEYRGGTCATGWGCKS